MTAQRIQLRRTKGWRKPEGAIVVARPSKWGNPYRIGDKRSGGPLDRLAVVAAFAEAAPVAHYRRLGVFGRYPTRDEIRTELAGHDLACWCRPDDLCHADILLAIANPDLDQRPWLVTIGTKSAIVQAATVTTAAIKVRGHTARPATPAEVDAWNECRDLTRALSGATATERRELLGIAEPADYDVPLFATPEPTR